MVALVIAGAVGAAACGSSEGSSESSTVAVDMSMGSDPSTSFNEADVEFAQSMIPHHEQAIEMAEMALDPTMGAGEVVVDLATRIREGQDPEIDVLADALGTWEMSMTMGTDDGHEMSSMAGMMSAAELDQLGALRGDAFDSAWAKAMIAHHRGAIEMAEAVKGSGVNRRMLSLADAVIAAQTQEIDEMESIG